MRSWIRSAYLTGLHKIVEDYAGPTVAKHVFGAAQVTPDQVADPYSVLDYSTVSSVYDALLLNVDSVSNLMDQNVASGAPYNPLRLAGQYAFQCRSRTMAEYWGRIQSVMRLLINGQQCAVRSNDDEIVIFSDWADYPGVGVPLMGTLCAVPQIRYLADLHPLRINLPFPENRWLRARLSAEVPNVPITFKPPTLEIVYDRSSVMQIEPLPLMGEPLTYADLLERYYPPRLVEGALAINKLVERIVFEDFQEPTLDLIASHAGLPRHQLQRRFSAGGLTVRSMVERVRVQRAENMLADTDASVIEIATAVGYASQQTLTRSFKRLRGLTPTEYRKLVREREQPKVVALDTARDQAPKSGRR